MVAIQTSCKCIGVIFTMDKLHSTCKIQMVRLYWKMRLIKLGANKLYILTYLYEYVSVENIVSNKLTFWIEYLVKKHINLMVFFVCVIRMLRVCFFASSIQFVYSFYVEMLDYLSIPCIQLQLWIVDSRQLSPATWSASVESELIILLDIFLPKNAMIYHSQLLNYP